MTSAAELPDDALPHKSLQASCDLALPLWKVIAITLLAVCVISLPNLIDPFIRHDDYPALLLEAQWFWHKTLHEGRWLNYIWHLRGIFTPSWLNFAIYQTLWAVLSAALAVGAMGRQGQAWFTIVLALFIVVSPSATMISFWFNTLIPGLGVVTVYALLGCWTSQRTLRALLPVFVIVSFSAYTTYPLILLAVCLIHTRHRSLRDLFGLMALFILSFIAAVFLTYALNWHVHGVFGIPLDSWRNATPASDIAGMIANLPALGETFKTLMLTGAYSSVPAAYFHIGLLLTSTLVLAYHRPLEALYLQAGLLAGLALIVLQVLKLGVETPARAFIFAWVFYAVIVVRATKHLSLTPDLPGRLMRNGTMLVILFYLAPTFNQYKSYRAWQAETRMLGTALNTVDPAISVPVFVYGDVMTLDSAKTANIESELALTFRVLQMTGHKVVLCHSSPQICTEIETSRRTAGLPASLKVQVESRGDANRLTAPLQ